MRFIVSLLYYNRPNMVKNAIKSVLNQTYDNWILACVDDGDGTLPLEPILKELNVPLEKLVIYTVGDSNETKRARGYSQFGRFINEGFYELDGDIGVVLCDDDMLFPDYLEKLNHWFTENDSPYGFCHVSTYNPFTDSEPYEFKDYFTNHQHPVMPSCQVDSSQVVFRISSMRNAAIKFPENQTANLDATVYADMGAKWGVCPPFGFLGQYKGIYDTQLTHRQHGEAYSSVVDLP